MLQATILIAALFTSNYPVTYSEVGPVPVDARAASQAPAGLATPDAARAAVGRARVLADEIIAASYPEFKTLDIRIKPFRSRSDYFKVRFGIPQYFFARMRYLLFINPRVFELQAPEAGVRAIIAHELGHVAYFRMRNRARLVGLVRLTSKLSEKHRNYFSPDEIDAILSASRNRPQLIEYWLKHVPLSLNEILATK